MNYKQRETAREIRLWISQVIVPAAMTVSTVMAIPEARKVVTDKYHKAKEAINKKFKKH